MTDNSRYKPHGARDLQGKASGGTRGARIARARSWPEYQELSDEFQRVMRHLKRSREELVAANTQLEELSIRKEAFIAKVSHELRTPLTSIKEGVNLILDRTLGHTTVEQQDFLETIDSETDRLTVAIDDLVALGGGTDRSSQPATQRLKTEETDRRQER